MKPLLRGLSAGIIGYLVGAAITAVIRGGSLGDPASVAIGFAIGLVAWLMGVGAWDAWGRDWTGRPARPTPEVVGWRRYLRFSTDHKVVGIQYLVTFVVVFLLGGAMAMLVRAELIGPGKDLLDADAFNRVMSLHGILMIAVAVAAILGGFGNYLIPLMIGAEDVAFPRLNALSYWLIPPVAVVLLLAPFSGFDTGWTSYPPLAVVNGNGQVLFLVGLITFGLSSILGGLNFIATIVTMRAPGMTWFRMPIFVWSVFAASLLSLLVTQFFAASLLMILLDRVAGMAFFDAARGGDPLVYQHLFWFYSHPAVYIMVLPGLGIFLEVLTHFSRKPLFGYRLAVGGFLGIVGMSGIVWAHHMFTSGMSEALHAPFMILTELISIPTGLVFLAAIGTIWRGRLWLQTPMLFAFAVLLNFLIGGITGIFLADVATDIQLQDTYFIVAHFHYTIMGAEIFALFAGIYYWFPKVTGRMYNERLGKLHAWWMFIGFNLTFLPQFWLGLHGMNRRIAVYDADLVGPNRFSSIAAFVLGSSFLVFVFNAVRSARWGKRASANPWGATTLEWQTSSPPPVHNFDVAPQVDGDPYPYGTEGRQIEFLGAPADHTEENL
ncbi:MAG: cytochrome c oxidase subunit I [Ilumatobacteraceae bacterium]